MAVMLTDEIDKGRDEFMRIWVGVHPFELDNQRLLAQHSEVHAALGTIRSIRQKNDGIDPQTLKYPSTLEGWTDGKGMAALLYLHTLLTVRIRALGYTEDSPLMVERFMLHDAHQASHEVSHLFKNQDQVNLLGVPEKWPPRWITSEQKIADIMDLQARWKHEGKAVQLNRSLERYGEWPNGCLSGSRTEVLSIPENYVLRYNLFREDRKKKTC